MAEHRVGLFQRLLAFLQRGDAEAGAARDRIEIRIGMRQEFMQRRVGQAAGDRTAGHDLEQRGKVVALSSEERRVGKEWVSTGRSQWVPFPLKKNNKNTTMHNQQ